MSSSPTPTWVSATTTSDSWIRERRQHGIQESLVVVADTHVGVGEEDILHVRRLRREDARPRVVHRKEPPRLAAAGATGALDEARSERMHACGGGGEVEVG